MKPILFKLPDRTGDLASGEPTPALFLDAAPVLAWRLLNLSLEATAVPAVRASLSQGGLQLSTTTKTMFKGLASRTVVSSDSDQTDSGATPVRRIVARILAGS